MLMHKPGKAISADHPYGGGGGGGAISTDHQFPLNFQGGLNFHKVVCSLSCRVPSLAVATLRISWNPLRN